MIQGSVNAFRQPPVTLAVRGSNGQTHDYQTTVDTGFSGFMTLAPSVIAALGFPFAETKEYTLGDGSDIDMRLYRGVVVWDGQDKTILIVEADGDALIGMEILEGYTLFVDAVEGGEVRIEPRRGNP